MNCGRAASLHISDNLIFSECFYLTGLAAQAFGRDINIQMRGIISGCYQMDRVWLPGP